MKGRKVTKVAVAPDGTKVTRQTDRDYTHAVLVYSDGTWGRWSFNGSLQGALRDKRKAERVYGGENVYVTEVK